MLRFGAYRLSRRIHATVLEHQHRASSLTLSKRSHATNTPPPGVNANAHLRTDAHCAPYPKRTHNCGALTAADVGSRVVLAGWILPERKVSKAMSFFPIKDSFGTTQLLVQKNHAMPAALALGDVPIESTVLIEGVVRLRPERDQRPDSTGQVEVHVDSFTLLNPALRELPFVPSDAQNLANDDLRARYRYLDLRRTVLSENLRKRSQVARVVRNVLDQRDFLQVETPMLLKSTPEGAREFLVPTRSASGAGPLFYALPQSPQQPKQLLICSGSVDRYYQLARCFRDEDGRKDRQPEFTQIDLEMAYVSWGPTDPSDGWRIGGIEVREVIEELIREVWARVEGVTLANRFKVMTYHEAMTRFGSDKPDTRFGLEIKQIAHLLPPSTATALENIGQIAECIILRPGQEPDFFTAGQTLELQDDADIERIVINDDNISTWIHRSRILGESTHEGSCYGINEALPLDVGDIIWLSRRRRSPEGGATALGRLRLRLSEIAQARGDYTPPAAPHFLWVTEFPLFTRADADKDFLAHGRWSSSHHPFTAPMWEDIEAMYNGHVETVRGQHYDLVLNGVEIGGGSVRVHDAAMQEYIFSNVLQLDDTEKASFNHLLHALKCGAPPHGGIALGFDRLMAILCKTQSIRDVIAFPKTGAGTDLLFQSPASVESKVLEQYGIKPQ
ncbi:hypothetical protein PLICRDRAFT_34734 [Plicaturopsis crispa FD-325 SS-3]|nr:hypothetical protein PLICRDRAFT_34734 [Plicaturopsis crispa FD-325 SS-3]